MLKCENCHKLICAYSNCKHYLDTIRILPDYVVNNLNYYGNSLVNLTCVKLIGGKSKLEILLKEKCNFNFRLRRLENVYIIEKC